MWGRPLIHTDAALLGKTFQVSHWMALKEELIEFNSCGLNFNTTVALTWLTMTCLQFLWASELIIWSYFAEVLCEVLPTRQYPDNIIGFVVFDTHGAVIKIRLGFLETVGRYIMCEKPHVGDCTCTLPWDLTYSQKTHIMRLNHQRSHIYNISSSKSDTCNKSIIHFTLTQSEVSMIFFARN